MIDQSPHITRCFKPSGKGCRWQDRSAYNRSERFIWLGCWHLNTLERCLKTANIAQHMLSTCWAHADAWRFHRCPSVLNLGISEHHFADIRLTWSTWMCQGAMDFKALQDMFNTYIFTQHIYNMCIYIFIFMLVVCKYIYIYTFILYILYAIFILYIDTHIIYTYYIYIYIS